MRKKIIIKDSFWVMLAALWLADDGNALFLFLAAAFLHELGHAAILFLTGGRFLNIKLAAYGAVMNCNLPEGKYRRAAICLAGPAVSFFAATVAAKVSFYSFAGANALLGLFNLLPIPPLDGGMVIMHLCEDRFENTQNIIFSIAAVGLTIAGFWLFIKGGGLWLMFVGGFVVLQRVKNLAKNERKV